MKYKLTKQEIEFLKESNKIEQEYSEEALEDAILAWKYAKKLNFKSPYNLTKSEIQQVHKRLMKRLNPRIAGIIRTVPVYVGNSKGYRECMKPELIKERLQKLTEIWNKERGFIKSYKGDKRKENLIKIWHVSFENIHPFEDGNGRTGRILMNIQRLKIGLPLLIIHTGQEQQDYYKWFSIQKSSASDKEK